MFPSHDSSSCFPVTIHANDTHTTIGSDEKSQDPIVNDTPRSKKKKTQPTKEYLERNHKKHMQAKKVITTRGERNAQFYLFRKLHRTPGYIDKTAIAPYMDNTEEKLFRTPREKRQQREVERLAYKARREAKQKYVIKLQEDIAKLNLELTPTNFPVLTMSKRQLRNKEKIQKQELEYKSRLLNELSSKQLNKPRVVLENMDSKTPQARWAIRDPTLKLTNFERHMAVGQCTVVPLCELNVNREPVQKGLVTVDLVSWTTTEWRNPIKACRSHHDVVHKIYSNDPQLREVQATFEYVMFSLRHLPYPVKVQKYNNYFPPHLHYKYDMIRSFRQVMHQKGKSDKEWAMLMKDQNDLEFLKDLARDRYTLTDLSFQQNIEFLVGSEIVNKIREQDRREVAAQQSIYKQVPLDQLLSFYSGTAADPADSLRLSRETFKYVKGEEQYTYHACQFKFNGTTFYLDDYADFDQARADYAQWLKHVERNPYIDFIQYMTRHKVGLHTKPTFIRGRKIKYNTIKLLKEKAQTTVVGSGRSNPQRQFGMLRIVEPRSDHNQYIQQIKEKAEQDEAVPARCLGVLRKLMNSPDSISEMKVDLRDETTYKILFDPGYLSGATKISPIANTKKRQNNNKGKGKFNNYRVKNQVAAYNNNKQDQGGQKSGEGEYERDLNAQAKYLSQTLANVNHLVEAAHERTNEYQLNTEEMNTYKKKDMMKIINSIEREITEQPILKLVINERRPQAVKAHQFDVKKHLFPLDLRNILYDDSLFTTVSPVCDPVSESEDDDSSSDSEDETKQTEPAKNSKEIPMIIAQTRKALENIKRQEYSPQNTANINDKTKDVVVDTPNQPIPDSTPQIMAGNPGDHNPEKKPEEQQKNLRQFLEGK